MTSSYVPCPIDTRGVELEEHLLCLIEILAKHAHDVWALQRLADGWTWGPSRCDTLRTHPCLVPYEDLPESEKQYDRNAATGIIRAVIASGYRILPVDGRHAEPARAHARPV